MRSWPGPDFRPEWPRQAGREAEGGRRAQSPARLSFFPIRCGTIGAMGKLLRAELPYREDSAGLFEAVADLPWAVFLDSGRHHLTQSRYDIVAAEPHITLTTRGKLTEIRGEAIELSRDDPLALLRQHLAVDSEAGCELPFCGGAIGYFAYDLKNRLGAAGKRTFDIKFYYLATKYLRPPMDTDPGVIFTEPGGYMVLDFIRAEAE